MHRIENKLQNYDLVLFGVIMELKLIIEEYDKV